MNRRTKNTKILHATKNSQVHCYQFRQLPFHKNLRICRLSFTRTCRQTPILYIYIKDTTNFINKIKDVIVDDKTTLVTMDVSSLYTNIPNDKGSNAVKQTQDTTTIHQNNIGISTSNPYTKQFYFLTASATY